MIFQPNIFFPLILENYLVFHVYIHFLLFSNFFSIFPRCFDILQSILTYCRVFWHILTYCKLIQLIDFSSHSSHDEHKFWVPWWPCFITMLFPWYENSIVIYSLSIFQLQFNKQYINKITVKQESPKLRLTFFTHFKTTSSNTALGPLCCTILTFHYRVKPQKSWSLDTFCKTKICQLFVKIYFTKTFIKKYCPKFCK